MSINDLANMIDTELGVLLTFGGVLWLWLYFKVDKIYDELKEIKKDKERKENDDEHNRDCF